MGVSDGGVVGIDWEKKGETMDGGLIIHTWGERWKRMQVCVVVDTRKA
jgi:hypothetical protein